MKLDLYHILLLVAGGLAVGGLVKPAWPLVAVGLLLTVVALLVGR